MIYHFCNTAFGRTFRTLAAGYAREHRVAITTVMTKAPIRERDLGSPLVIADINDSSFLQRTVPGDHGIVSGFSQIFKEEAIACFASLVNIHASLLPFYRGPSPTHWCIARNEPTTGFTLHRITAKIDAGEILYQEVVPIDGERDPETLATRIAAAAGPIFVRYLDHLRTGEPWIARVVDASSVYVRPVPYLSFAPRDR
jgi:methionyl-tRNA formyltransferase